MIALTGLCIAALFGAPLELAAPTAPAPLPAGLPPGERFVLDNGLVVVLVPQTGNPYLDVRLAFRAGAAADPAELAGLAVLTGSLLTGGVDAPDGSLDETALANELARLGGWIGDDVTRESFGLEGQIPTLSEVGVRRFLDLFVAVALAPSFPAPLVERDKTLRLAELDSFADDAAGLADALADEVALGPGPFGRMAAGNKATVSRLTRADVLAFHAAVTNPRHGVLVIGGAFDVAAMRAWIAARFGGSAFSRAARRATPGEVPGRLASLCATVDGAERCFDNPYAHATTAPAPRPRTVHVVVDDPSLSQLPYRLVAPNPVSQLDPRWAALKLGTFVLGGDFTSRLNALLRTREGLTYGAYLDAGFGAHRSGAMTVSTDATPDALGRAITLADGEIDALSGAPLSASELDESRAMMVNGFPFTFETIIATVDQYFWLEVDAQPLSWLAGWCAALAKPSAAEVQAAMKAAFPAGAKGMSLVVVGPASLDVSPFAHGPVTRIDARAWLAGLAELPGLAGLAGPADAPRP